MNFQEQIKALLHKHKAHPAFPFLHWRRDEAAFWALRALYHDLFVLSADDMAAAFHDVMPPRFDPHGMAFDKRLHPEPSRRVSLAPITRGGMMLMTIREADEGYQLGKDGMHGLPDRSWLSLSVDFSPRRLAAAAQAIRLYVSMPFTDLHAETELGQRFVDELGPVFERPGRRRAELSVQGETKTYNYVPRRRSPATT
jgi:hypothetical protein